MTRNVTLQDVADAAHVSKATVSNVFSWPERVRPELRARIEAVAREIGYAGPDPRGRLLSSGKVNAIGLVAPAEFGFSWFFADPYMSRFITGVAQVCEERGAALSLVSATEKNGAGGVRNAIVDGFILGTIDQAGEIEPALRRRLPFVVMDAEGGPDISSVRINDLYGGYRLARHLIDLGHRRFAVCAPLRRDIAPALHRPGDADRALLAAYPTENERVAGIAKALAEAGLSMDDVPIVETCCTEREKSAHGIDGAALLLDNAAGATAVIALSGTLALAVLAEARNRGMAVPRDLSIVGFDDPPEVALADPPLTCIAQPVVEKGRTAARILFEGGPAQHVVLPVELKIRSSTAAPPAATID